MATTPLGLGSFCQARALSTRNDDPQRASRPWDRDRDGFVLSDGAGAVLLEEYEHAKTRGARIYAELVGFGMSGDAHHITAPPEDGEGARLAMANALQDAKLNPGDVQYVNAHATSTELGDRAETIAMKRCFGDHAAKLAVSSTKSMTGHLLGAAGAVEAIFSILAIRDRSRRRRSISTIRARAAISTTCRTRRGRMPIRVALSNSFGFGGTNGTLIFRASARLSILEPVDVDPAALLALHAASPHLYPALFESAAAGEPLGRFDILFAHPAGQLRGIRPRRSDFCRRSIAGGSASECRRRATRPAVCRSRAAGSSTSVTSSPGRSSRACGCRNLSPARSRRRFAFPRRSFTSTTAVVAGSSPSPMPPS